MDIEEDLGLIVIPEKKKFEVNQELSEFNICQEVFHHDKTLRTIDSTENSLVLTGSLDKTCAFFIKENDKYSFLKESLLHDDFVYKVFRMNDKKSFLTAGKDMRIIMMDNDGNPLKEFAGHTGAVNSLSQYKNNIFISGSWDGTARIWDIEKNDCLFTLKDHSYAVSVCAFPDDLFITASQDKRIRFWRNDSNIKNVDNAHEDIIRDITPNSDYSLFYTCSNDQTIKQWNLMGQCLLTLTGHEGFIFRVISSGNFLFSCGDDKVLKVWNSKCTLFLIIFFIFISNRT